MGEWKEYTIEQLVNVQNGFAFKSNEYVINAVNVLEVFKMGHIERGSGLRKSPKKDFVPREERLEKWILDKNDIVMAMTDMKDNVVILGVPALIDKSNYYVLNQRVARLVVKDKTLVNCKFLYNYLRWDDFLFNLQSKANSGVQVNLSTETIKKSVVLIPTLEEQDAIAEALSSLDDKIDLLHHQNQTLEALAQILFRQYFVDEANDEWETCKLEDIAVIQNGFSFSSGDYVPYEKEHLEVLKMGHIKKGGGLKLNPKKDFVPREEKLEKWILEKDDIVMAMTDMKDNVVILGVPAIIDESNRYVLNQRVARIYLKSNARLLNNYLLYTQLKDPDFIALLQSKANSGVQVNLSTQSIKDSEIIIPPMRIQETVGKHITDLFLKKENNDLQIRTLESMRDTLLPKLMSGEVRVKI